MALTGGQVVAKHQQALSMCAGQVGWALLSCIVDAMQAVYGKRGGAVALRPGL